MLSSLCLTYLCLLLRPTEVGNLSNFISFICVDLAAKGFGTILPMWGEFHKCAPATHFAYGRSHLRWKNREKVQRNGVNNRTLEP